MNDEERKKIAMKRRVIHSFIQMDGDDYGVRFDCAKINSNDDSCLTLQSPRYKPRINHYMPTKLKWMLSYLSNNKVTKRRIEMENERKNVDNRLWRSRPCHGEVRTVEHGQFV